VARATTYSPRLAARIGVHLTFGDPLEVAAQAEGVSAASLQRGPHRYPAFRPQGARAPCVTACLGDLHTAAEGAPERDWAARTREPARRGGGPPARQRDRSQGAVCRGRGHNGTSPGAEGRRGAGGWDGGRQPERLVKRAGGNGVSNTGRTATAAAAACDSGGPGSDPAPGAAPGVR
jgi:hypothetical protein